MSKRLCVISAVLLLSACAVPPSYHGYIAANNQQGVEQLYQAGYDIDGLQYWGTPLAVAARTNNIESARYLIDKGADVNRGNADGYESKTPLHAAAAHNSVEIARLLLENGARTDIRNRENQIPLEVARIKGHQDMIDLLTQFEAEQTAWQQTREADTWEAYDVFLDNHPQSLFQAEAESRRDHLRSEHEAETLKQQQLARLEASLPPAVRRDKLMIQLSEHLKNSNYQQALEVFPKLEQLPVATDPSLKFFYGEALLETGNPTGALQKFYEYITEQGSGATHYARALALINKAESQL